MRFHPIAGWFLLIAAAAGAFHFENARAQAAGRGKEQIVSDLAAATLPKVDVAATADPSYVASFTRQRDAARRKRAGLILELYTVAPDLPEMQGLLSERWQALVQDGQVEQAIAEMSAYLSGDASAREKEATAFQRAQTIIQRQAQNTSARLEAIDGFRKFVSQDQAGTMVPQLLYWTGRLASDSSERERLLAKVVADYPKSPAARLILGATRRQDAVGKTMAMAFNDAITGTPIDIADFRGKVVVVDFWAAWCTDCAAEMPHMKKVYADFRDRGVVFIGVSLDLPEAEGGLAALKAAVSRHQLKWPQYYLGKEWDSDFSSQWGVFSVPAVFVVNPLGKVVSSDAGAKLEAILSDLLKGAAQ